MCIRDRNNANDTADRIEAYAKKSGMEVVETIFNTDKKAVERLRYYICLLYTSAVNTNIYNNNQLKEKRCEQYKNLLEKHVWEMCIRDRYSTELFAFQPKFVFSGRKQGFS